MVAILSLIDTWTGTFDKNKKNQTVLGITLPNHSLDDWFKNEFSEKIKLIYFKHGSVLHNQNQTAKLTKKGE